jgi:para-nitrobenzyl esterase
MVGGVAVFKGIPYAAAPFGPNRFRPPQSAAPWEGVRDALAYGPTAPKPGYPPPFDALLAEPAIPGEDCLNLNIWTPDLSQAHLPVMVWIHGGSFSNGSGAVPTYDGTHFARDGVVCVTINYRLNVDGFLALGDGIANLGLLDQLAALTWVQENIAAFGGDPTQVTVFGESAGGMSVGVLLAMPRAAGLFRQAILQSGAGHYALSPQTAARIGGYLAEELGVEPTRAALAAVPLDRLVQAYSALRADLVARPDPQRWGEVAFSRMVFQPVIDGDILPALPISRIAAGSAAEVPVLVGNNSEEQRLFLVPTGVVEATTDDVLAMTAGAYRLPVADALATYRAARPGASAGDLLAAIVTDWFYRIPAIRLAEARATVPAATYVYEFAWRSPQFDGRLGACHALEIGFVFDNLDEQENHPLTGTAPPQPLAAAMHTAWVSFAMRGDPGWPRYDLGRRATMRFDTTSAVVDDPAAAERVVWEGIR